jgi:predicted  nucleic acid-binding Zn-ribbon protein
LVRVNHCVQVQIAQVAQSSEFGGISLTLPLGRNYTCKDLLNPFRVKPWENRVCAKTDLGHFTSRVSPEWTPAWPLIAVNSRTKLPSRGQFGPQGIAHWGKSIMTNVGKIFTVVVFILSIFYMALGVMVLATHKNWKDVVAGVPGDPTKPGMKKQVADLESVNTQLRTELENLRNALAQEQNARRMAIPQLTIKLQQSEAAVRSLNDQLAKLTADQGVLVKNLETQQQNLDKATNEVASLRELIKKAQTDRDNVFASYVDLLEQVNQANTQLVVLEERGKLLSDELAIRKDIMAKLGIPMDEPTEKLAQDVKGEIREVSGDKVVISIGFDDGIRVGQELNVFTKTAFRGKVRVIKVEPDKAVGEIIPDLLKGRMQRGDSVANKIS